ncbi:MAG: BatD family protein [Opitutales bacterium]
MKKLLTIITLFFLFLGLKLEAQEITTNGFSPAKLRPSAVSSYIISIKNANGTVELSDISAKIPEGLKLLDQSQSRFSNASWNNGVMTNDSGVNLTLSFAAEKEGTYTIEAWEAKIGDKSFPIPAHTLIVDSNAPVNVQQSNSPFSSRLDPFSHMRQLQQMMGANRYQNQAQAEKLDLSNLINVKLQLEKEKIYVGESVPCNIILEVDKELLVMAQVELGQVLIKAKDADAFTCQDVELKPTKDENSNHDKVIYKYSTIITPNKVGSYSLSYNIQGIFAGRSFYSNNYRFDEVAKIDAVNVSALPNVNVPASFTGAIGSFTLSGNSIDPSSASVGELITQSFSISGTGNFNRISAPELKSDENWKVYEPSSEFIDEGKESFQGKKTFTYRMVAQKPDLEYAPTLSFSYFNPEKELYEVIEIPAHKVSIYPAARVNSIAVAPIQAGQFDIISNTEVETQNNTPLFARADFWIYQTIIIVLLVLVIIYRRRILFLRNNPAVVKNSKEKRAAKIHLKYAKKYAFEANPKNFFDSAIKAIQFSLSRTEDIQAPSITLKDAQRLIEKRGLENQDIDIFFNSIDAINYAGAKSSSFDLIQLEKNLRDICKNLLG